MFAIHFCVVQFMINKLNQYVSSNSFILNFFIEFNHFVIVISDRDAPNCIYSISFRTRMPVFIFSLLKLVPIRLPCESSLCISINTSISPEGEGVSNRGPTFSHWEINQVTLRSKNKCWIFIQSIIFNDFFSHSWKLRMFWKTFSYWDKKYGGFPNILESFKLENSSSWPRTG